MFIALATFVHEWLFCHWCDMLLSVKISWGHLRVSPAIWFIISSSDEIYRCKFMCAVDKHIYKTVPVITSIKFYLSLESSDLPALIFFFFFGFWIVVCRVELLDFGLLKLGWVRLNSLFIFVGDGYKGCLKSQKLM